MNNSSSKTQNAKVAEYHLADDLLRGVSAIAEHLGESPRRTHYLLEKGDLPAFKLRGRWHLRKSRLLDHIAKLEAGDAS